MKKLLTSSLLLFSLLNVNAASAEQLSAEALLQDMSQATQQLNYELSYILIKKNSIEPLVYRHANLEDQQLAHLVYLSGPIREVIRRGNEVSYIEPGVDPFTIESGKMVAPLMPLIGTDINQIGQYYDYVHMGRAREVGVATQVFRIVPKDGLRYSYVLWIDEETKLPLRADLLDRDGEILEQYRVISYTVNQHFATALSSLNDVQLPAVLALPKGDIESSDWEVTWVPDGFDAKELNRYAMFSTEHVVESQMFSDGLFSFSVYVSESDNQSLNGPLIRQGRRTVHNIVIGSKQISVVGDIPPATAQRIAKSVLIKSSSPEVSGP
ncbi:sigma-E factor regulatory protein RseB [Vibrio hippocampi]|uniref:Sigma-E factor regulatory protein RseB n=1 Tax=Vibrio hippocampi TaxID=654686 RepID=A0ABN8DJV0_9VIBR|nr:sigma-E factor regulatory protein RseB [Vibrio hippocampi]CAH0527152.1 Sigma-E factor regulatory protein RseB [Vibrio hippocampi]